MGHIRVRKETGNLLFDFRYLGHRCREQTTLKDTPQNRKKLQVLLERIEAEILLKQFDYARYFPDSSMLEKIETHQRQLQQHLGTETPDFAAFAKRWFDEMKVGWRVSYRETVQSILDNRLIPLFGDRDIAQISKADLMRFRATLAEEKRPNGANLSPSYINRHMKLMRMILAEAADRYDFVNPYRGIKPLKTPRPDIEPFTLDEVNRILSTVRQDYKPYYIVRFFTGMRTGEIHGLKWRYVDFDKRLILVRECWIKGRTEYTKTDGSQRDIQMAQPVYDALKAHFELHQATHGSSSGYVFATRNGRPLNHTNVTNRVWHPLLRHLGLRRRSPYQTRHTAATLWLASGENPEWIARQMGHANTEMLFRVYSRFVPNLTRRDGSAFEQLLQQTIRENNDHEAA